MSFRSHTVAPTRVFDHLFDPIFTTSDPKCLHKENSLALTRSAPIRVYPVYNSMFSELSYEERNCYAYQRNDLPLHFKSDHSQIKKYNSITGTERPKFFCNPLSNTRTINVGLMADKNEENENNEEFKKLRSKSIQTLYRESSSQTQSWLPECFTKEITSDILPEVVFVADILESISYPGIKEIEIVERARKRRMWETTLPPIKTANEIPPRVAALEAFEWEEWIAREKDINECQQVRLEIVSDLINKREEKHKTDTDLKIQNCKKRALNERNHQKDLLIQKFQRCMRKIDFSQRKEVMKNLKDDPVLLHYDKKSDYAIPKIHIKKGSKLKKQYQFENLNTFNKNKFASLEREEIEGIQNYFEPSRQDLWIPKKRPKEIMRGVWNESYLKRLHETLKHFRHKKKYQRKVLEKIPSSRNESFLLQLPLQASDDHDDENYQNKMLIQKTIKGRAIQSMLQKGMKKIQDVIEETKETHSIASVKNIFPIEFCQQIDRQKEIMTEYKQLEAILRNDLKLQKELDSIESRDVKQLLDYFEKKLIHLNSEKQAHALYLLAERERYRREAENFGEKNCKNQFEEDSITIYLENILLEGINRAFDENSRCIIKEIAQNIDKKAEKKVKFNENFNDINQVNNTKENVKKLDGNKKSFNQEIITNLLKSSIISEQINKLKNTERDLIQKQYLIEAHHYLYRTEYENFIKEETLFLCSSIFNEIFDNATKIPFESEKEKLLRQQSEDAEILATKIVEDILQNIIINDEKDDLYKSYMDSNHNANSMVDEEKTIDEDFLAEVVTQDILNNIILSSSSSEKSENIDFF